MDVDIHVLHSVMLSIVMQDVLSGGFRKSNLGIFSEYNSGITFFQKLSFGGVFVFLSDFLCVHALMRSGLKLFEICICTKLPIL